MIRAHAYSSGQPPAAGAGDIITSTHYSGLARRLLERLGDRRGFALVTGDVPADADLLTQAIAVEGGSEYWPIIIRCRPELTLDELRRAGREKLPEPRPIRLLLLGGADTLSDELLEAIYQSALLGGDDLLPVVLVAGPDFAARLERPGLRFLAQALIARCHLQQVGRESAGTAAPLGGRSQPFNPASLLATLDQISRELSEAPVQVTSREPAASAGPTPAAAPAPPAALLAPPVAAEPPARRRWPAALLISVAYVAVACAASLLVFHVLRPEGSTVTSSGVIAGLRWLRAVEETLDRRPPPAAMERAPPPALLPMPVALEPPPAVTSAVPDVTSAVPDVTSAVPDVAPAVPGVALPAPAPAAAPLSLPPPILEAAAPPSAEIASPPTPEVTPPPSELPNQEALPPARPEVAPPASREAMSLAPPRREAEPAEVASLLKRGDQLMSTGDVASARLFYERAAEAGDARAALALGKTFDPLFLGRAGVRGDRGDAAKAAEWYRRASEAGVSEAGQRLKTLLVRPKG